MAKTKKTNKKSSSSESFSQAKKRSKRLIYERARKTGAQVISNIHITSSSMKNDTSYLHNEVPVPVMADSKNTINGNSSSGYMMNRIDPSSFNWVEIRRSKEKTLIEWDEDATNVLSSGPVTAIAENCVISTLIRKGEFISGHLLSSQRIDEILSICNQFDMSLSQALSLRKQLLVETVKFIIRKEPKYYDNPSYLNDYDKYQLEYAKEIDQLSYKDVISEERNASERWEYSLYNYLDSKGVSYLNETNMIEQKFSVTPDAVILGDLSINGIKVHWIDCKCFYGSTQSSTFMKQLQKQVAKYNIAFGGPGAIIYKLGFSENLQKVMKKYDCLVVDKGPLIDLDESDDVLANRKWLD
eukprot:gene6668-9150_t